MQGRANDVQWRSHVSTDARTADNAIGWKGLGVKCGVCAQAFTWNGEAQQGAMGDMHKSGVGSTDALCIFCQAPLTDREVQNLVFAAAGKRNGPAANGQGMAESPTICSCIVSEVVRPCSSKS